MTQRSSNSDDVFSDPGKLKLKPEMSKVTFSNLKNWLDKNLLLVITFSGVSFGFILGISLKALELDPTTISYIGYPGELFMRLLKLMILPLIIASLITGKTIRLMQQTFLSLFVVILPDRSLACDKGLRGAPISIGAFLKPQLRHTLIQISFRRHQTV